MELSWRFNEFEFMRALTVKSDVWPNFYSYCHNFEMKTDMKVKIYF